MTVRRLLSSTPIVAVLVLTVFACVRHAPLSITFHGIGPLRAGMTVTEASQALGTTLVTPSGIEPGGCHYVTWPGGPDGVLIMVEQSTIARVDVRSGTMATEAGARIGDSGDRIRHLYEGRVTVTTHKYSDGQYFTVTPISAADNAFRLIFEVEGGRVTRYRSGKLPQVEYVEGCS